MKARYFLQWRRKGGVGRYDGEWNRVLFSDCETEAQAQSELDWIRENAPLVWDAFEHRIQQVVE